jgi:hypothetical protein
LAELQSGGGRVLLREGVRLSLERVPKPFDELIAQPQSGEITVRAVPITQPWYARLEVDSNLGHGEIDIDLDVVEPADAWDAEWRGSKGDLELHIRTRWSVNEARGETALALRYRSRAAPIGTGFLPSV